MNLTQAEEMALATAPNEVAWDKLCDEIKAARSDRYPPDWWARVVKSGLMKRAADGWRRV